MVITVTAVPTTIGSFDFVATVGGRLLENDYADNTVTATVEVLSRPVAGDDSFIISQDVPRPIDVALELLANDTHPDDAPLTLQSWDGITSQGGAITGNRTALLYTPPAGFIGRDYFTYTVCDPDPECDQARVSIGVGEWHPTSAPTGALRLDVLPLDETAPGPGVLRGLRRRRPARADDQEGRARLLDNDRTKRQWWDLPLPAGRVMDRATVSFTFWSRVAFGANDLRGKVNVGLYDCAAERDRLRGGGLRHPRPGTPGGPGTGFLEARSPLGR